MYIFKFFRNFIFFIFNVWDLKFDFPFPPKKFLRIFNVYYWNTFFHLYRLRKIREKKHKIYWQDSKFKSASYKDWVTKVFLVQRGIFPENKFISEFLLDKNTTNILDVGCGSGASTACLLLSMIDTYFNNTSLKEKNRKIFISGIDLNEDRINEANTKVPIMFNYYSKYFELKFKKKNILNEFNENELFDYTFIMSVLDYLDDNQFKLAIKNLSKVTKKGFYICDFADNYPMNFIRNIDKFKNAFRENNFELKKYNYKITNSYPSSLRNQLVLEMFFVRIN